MATTKLSDLTTDLADGQRHALLSWQSDINFARAQLREGLRPLAVEVLGDWAADDAVASRHARGWTGHIQGDAANLTAVLVETLHGGHNDATTSKRHQIALTQ